MQRPALHRNAVLQLLPGMDDRVFDLRNTAPSDMRAWLAAGKVDTIEDMMKKFPQLVASLRGDRVLLQQMFSFLRKPSQVGDLMKLREGANLEEEEVTDALSPAPFEVDDSLPLGSSGASVDKETSPLATQQGTSRESAHSKGLHRPDPVEAARVSQLDVQLQAITDAISESKGLGSDGKQTESFSFEVEDHFMDPLDASQINWTVFRSIITEEDKELASRLYAEAVNGSVPVESPVDRLKESTPIPSGAAGSGDDIAAPDTSSSSDTSAAVGGQSSIPAGDLPLPSLDLSSLRKVDTDAAGSYEAPTPELGSSPPRVASTVVEYGEAFEQFAKAVLGRAQESEEQGEIVDGETLGSRLYGQKEVWRILQEWKGRAEERKNAPETGGKMMRTRSLLLMDRMQRQRKVRQLAQEKSVRGSYSGRGHFDQGVEDPSFLDKGSTASAQKERDRKEGQQTEEVSGALGSVARRRVNSKIDIEKVVELPNKISIKDLATMADVEMSYIQRQLEDLSDVGRLQTSGIIDFETAELVLLEHGIQAQRISSATELLQNSSVEMDELSEEDARALRQKLDVRSRPPIVCVMGHVDHGKTTLLDSIRSTSHAAREYGGITQSIGAFSVDVPENLEVDLPFITFLDTPGHAAFSAMRARGASTTDIIILVVGADDGVMPQTLEVIELAKSADVPLVVAINKMDRDGADADIIRTQLMESGVSPEDLGGDVPCVEISAKSKTGLDTLLEAVSLTAGMLDLDTAFRGPSECAIVESKYVHGAGCVLNIIVQRGTLRIGDVVVSGKEYGVVRRMTDETGKQLKEVSPGMAASVIAIGSLNDIGEELVVVASEDHARAIVEERDEERVSSDEWKSQVMAINQLTKITQRNMSAKRINYRQQMREKRRALRHRLRKQSRENEMGAGAEGNLQLEVDDKTVSLILKCDVNGSLDAILQYISQFPTFEDVNLNILSADVGPISSGDIGVAELGNAEIICFNLPNPSAETLEACRLSGVKFANYKIVYELFDHIRDAIASKLPKEEKVTLIAAAEVQKVFNLRDNNKKKNPQVGGVRVEGGDFSKSGVYRILRDREIIADNLSVESLKVFKDDAAIVEKGKECGISFVGIRDLREGDRIECVSKEYILPTIDDRAARGYRRT